MTRYRSKRTDTRLRSDQGTNFVGAENELKRSYQEMDDERIKAELLKHNIDWIRNPAMASNFGAAWERQIRSVRNIIAALMKQHGCSLDNESLQTMLCEVEAVVNSRPLTTESLSDPLSGGTRVIATKIIMENLLRFGNTLITYTVEQQCLCQYSA